MSQVAFVGCGQGIALVPATLKTLAPKNVVIRPLGEALNVVTTSLVWNTVRVNPWVEEIVATLGAAASLRRGRGRRGDAVSPG